jgi:outer membrane murein-binding lipoprotein Lpp
MKNWAVVFLILACTVHAADDPRVSFLEQEVRNLHRQVDQLSRQVDRLTTRPDRPRAAGTTPARAAAPESDQWVDAARWTQIRTGMSELDVIGTLGPPTSMREEDGARVLLYALEIGASGFLGGSVILRDRSVVEVRTPTLQ